MQTFKNSEVVGLRGSNQRMIVVGFNSPFIRVKFLANKPNANFRDFAKGNVTGFVPSQLVKLES